MVHAGGPVDTTKRDALLARGADDQTAIGGQIQVTVAVRRNTLAANQFLSGQGHGLKAVEDAAGQAAVGANPQRSIRGFVKRFNARAGKSVVGVEGCKVVAIV